MNPNWLNLTHLGMIQISGEGAKKLLQGQLSCDLELITKQQASLGALCNIKGRAISGFYLALFDDSYYLITSRDLVNKTLSTLKKYAVFFPVTLTDVSNSWQLIGTLNKLHGAQEGFCTSGSQAHGFYLNLTLDKPRFLLALPPETDLTEFQPLQTSSAWQQQDIQDHLTLLNEKTSEAFIPLELNYAQFNGISFKKGCYTGQEIIARIHYRGQLKQHLHSFELTLNEFNDLTLKNINNENNESAGQVVSSVYADGRILGLALIRDDQRNESLYIDGLNLLLNLKT